MIHRCIIRQTEKGTQSKRPNGESESKIVLRGGDNVCLHLLLEVLQSNMSRASTGAWHIRFPDNVARITKDILYTIVGVLP